MLAVSNGSSHKNFGYHSLLLLPPLLLLLLLQVLLEDRTSLLVERGMRKNTAQSSSSSSPAAAAPAQRYPTCPSQYALPPALAAQAVVDPLQHSWWRAARQQAVCDALLQGRPLPPSPPSPPPPR
jgi:hypothetical protein